ncbi:hypothetical protein [Streptomyces sp. NPDC101249]|uniref:hypothetical protein n=1 Tax=Streptomyces sp. NPDC101249 TaxID=3366140 RepID=UPI0037F79784
MNGIVWELRTGSAWRDVPDRYGLWVKLHTRFSPMGRRTARPGPLARRVHQQSSTGAPTAAAAGCSWSSPVGSGWTAPRCGRCWKRSGFPGSVGLDPATSRTAWRRTRHTATGLPRVPALAGHSAHHPGAGGLPSRTPVQGLTRRTAARLRRRPLRAAQHRRAGDQPAEAAPGSGHPLRHARLRLPRQPSLSGSATNRRPHEPIGR